MPVARPETSAPNRVVPDNVPVEISHFDSCFDYPGSDIILRSCDSHDFRLPQLYIVICSPVLRELIQCESNACDIPNSEEQQTLPIVRLPESKVTLYSLLTFIFPVAPVLPSTTEKIMELLSVAQKYQMNFVLTNIRGTISRQDVPLIRPETAFRDFFLARKYELHHEALQAARVTLRLPFTIEDLEAKLEFMPGAHLRELWKYHKQARTDLQSRLLEFKNADLPDNVKGLCCTNGRSPSHPFPRWLDDYIGSLAEALHIFDLFEFENVRARHIRDESQASERSPCQCAEISSQVVRAFWEALTVVVLGTIEKADSTLALVKEEPTSENSDTPSVPLCLDIPDANIIIRSSDQVNFRVRKSVLSISSPFFNDLLSLPQPPDDELVDGLPVVQLSEDAGVLNSLVSLLYPIIPVIPSSYEKVFALLAACQKYDMESLQSYIRAEIKRETFPAPLGAEGFRAYGIASSMGLIPEMESAARLTLGYPMTFESLGEGLRSFEGRALCDLVRYRKRCRDNFVACLDSFFDLHSRWQIWEGCWEWSSDSWLHNFITSKSVELKKGFMHECFLPSTIIEEYLVALKNHTHAGCSSCVLVHIEKPSFCWELEGELAQALDEPKVSVSSDKDPSFLSGP